MILARTAYQWVAWVAVATLPFLFFFAGFGTLGGESIDVHKVLGSLIELAAVLLLVFSIAGGMGRTVIVRSVVLVVVVFLEASAASEELDPKWLRSLHVPGAMLVAFLLSESARRAGMPWRHRPAEAGIPAETTARAG